MYKVIDLFAGAGGLSLGFEQAGFVIKKAVENNKWAKETYKKNHSNEVEIFDNIIDLHFSDKDIDVVIGGPPCQGFSNANRNKSEFINNNNLLVKEYFRVVKEISPKVFVLENVSSILSDSHLFFMTKEDEKNFNIKTTDKEFKLSLFEENNKFLKTFILNDCIDSRIFTYLIQEDLARILKILCKKNEDAKESYFKKNLSKIESLILKQQFHDEFFDYKVAIEESISNQLISEENDILIKKYIDLDKSIKFLKSLYENNIVYSFKESHNIFILKSYTVREYMEQVVLEDFFLQSFILNASDYGIPQNRRRFFLIGKNKKYFGQDTKLDFTDCTSKSYTIGDAIKDLEDVPVTTNIADSPPKYKNLSISRQNDYLKRIANSNLIYNHIVTETSEIALKRFKNLKQGQNFHDLPAELKSTYTNSGRTQNTIYQRLDYNSVSGTVVNVRKSMWVHPNLDRSISVREAARLQSFPDSFVFYGTKDSQYQQVGNAVPPLLALIIAKKVRQLLIE